MSETAEPRELVSGREFARRNNWAPSYIDKLKKADRLVIDDDTGKIDVDASMERLADTEDPAKDPVREYNAQLRAGNQQDAPDADDQQAAPPAGQAAAGDSDDKPPADGIGTYQENRARNEYYKAQKEELEHRRRAGELVEKTEVRKEAADLGKNIRHALLAIPGGLSQKLASMTDPVEIELALEDELHEALNRLADLAEPEGDDDSR